MSTDENLNNTEEAPQNDALEQDGNNSEGTTSDEAVEAVVDGDVESSADDTESTEDISDSTESPLEITQEQFNKAVKRAKKLGAAQGERQARKLMANEGSDQSFENGAASAHPNQVYDSVTQTWIDKNMTVGEYEAHVASVYQQPAQSSAQAPSVAQQRPVQQAFDSSKEASAEAMEQLENEIIHDEDIARSFVDEAPVTFTMLNTAVRSKTGVKMLTELYKSDPQRLFKISRQDNEEQQFQIRKLLEEQSAKAKKKLVTKSIPQSEKLKAAPHSEKSDMTLSERKAAYLSNEG